MSNSTSYYELYRKTTVGISLIESLDTLISDQRIEPQLAMRILNNFDRIIADRIKEELHSKLTFKGHLHIYRFCDDVWTFVLKDVDLRLDENGTGSVNNNSTDNLIHADTIEIVANNSKKIGEAWTCSCLV